VARAADAEGCGVKVRSKAIWLTAVGVIGYGLAHQLEFFDVIVILIMAKLLDKCLGDEDEKPVAAETLARPEAVFSIPAGKHLISTDGVKHLRNLLLKHHNMKQTDSDYTESAMSRDTVAIVATLNVFLKGKT
jgi:hypothetical protein